MFTDNQLGLTPQRDLMSHGYYQNDERKKVLVRLWGKDICMLLWDCMTHCRKQHEFLQY